MDRIEGIRKRYQIGQEIDAIFQKMDGQEDAEDYCEATLNRWYQHDVGLLLEAYDAKDARIAELEREKDAAISYIKSLDESPLVRCEACKWAIKQRGKLYTSCLVGGDGKACISESRFMMRGTEEG